MFEQRRKLRAQQVDLLDGVDPGHEHRYDRLIADRREDRDLGRRGRWRTDRTGDRDPVSVELLELHMFEVDRDVWV